MAVAKCCGSTSHSNDAAQNLHSFIEEEYLLTSYKSAVADQQLYHTDFLTESAALVRWNANVHDSRTFEILGRLLKLLSSVR